MRKTQIALKMVEGKSYNHLTIKINTFKNKSAHIMTLNRLITSEKAETKYMNNVLLRNFRDEKKAKT